MSAWVLPDYIADVLPFEARHVEEIRRDLLDMARCYGYELVMPPLLEHLESLLSGTGEAAGEAVAKHTTVHVKRGESGVLAAKTTVECVQLRLPRR